MTTKRTVELVSIWAPIVVWALGALGGLAALVLPVSRGEWLGIAAFGTFTTYCGWRLRRAILTRHQRPHSL